MRKSLLQSLLFQKGFYNTFAVRCLCICVVLFVVFYEVSEGHDNKNLLLLVAPILRLMYLSTNTISPQYHHHYITHQTSSPRFFSRFRKKCIYMVQKFDRNNIIHKNKTKRYRHLIWFRGMGRVLRKESRRNF